MKRRSENRKRKQQRPAFLPALFLTAVFCCLLAGCGGTGKGTSKEHTAGIFAMDTYMSFRVYGGDEALLKELAARTEDLEDRLSVTKQDSEIAVLNREKEGSVSEETAALIETALSFCGKSGGAFDITIYPVLREWGFTGNAYHVPDPDLLEQKLAAVSYRNVAVADTAVTLAPETEIDLGGITKGYLGDRLIGILKNGGAESAIIDLGGNVACFGRKPDGSLWRVAVRDPKGEDYIGYLDVTDCSVVTSGGYERYFEDEDGNLWWHIIDPSTGFPAKNGLVSVTVVGSDGAYCDAMATALFVMGEEQAAAFWRQYQDMEMILVTEDGRLLVTEGLEKTFALSDAQSYAFSVIRK